MAKLATIQDALTDGSKSAVWATTTIALGGWGSISVSGSVTEASDGAACAPTDSTECVSGYSANDTALDFTDSEVVYELVEVETGAGSSAFRVVVCDEASGTNGGARHATWEYSYNFGTQTISAIYNNFGSVGTTFSATYSSTDHRWFRIRDTGSDIYWDTAPDNGSGAPGTWTNRRQLSVDGGTPATYVALTSASLGFYAYNPGTRTGIVYKIRNINPSASGYSLVAGNGSYALTGTAANTLYARIMAGEQGSYTLTGIDALLVKAGSYQFNAEVGSYTLVGANALVDVSMNAEAGSYALTGRDSTLNFAGFTNPTLTAEFGSYTLTGQASNTKYGRLLAAEVGVYALTGRQAGLIWSGAPVSTGYTSQRMTFSSLRISL